MKIVRGLSWGGIGPPHELTLSPLPFAPLSKNVAGKLCGNKQTQYVQVVLAPIAIGMTFNKFFPKFVKAILPFAPVVGVVSTCLLVASAVAQVAEPILNAGLSLQLPVLLLHLVGGLVGYWLPKITGFGEVKSRTMAIETSMKSSAFGFLLAKLHFGDYVARVPSAVSVVWMALTGSMLAVIWRYIPVKEDE